MLKVQKGEVMERKKIATLVEGSVLLALALVLNYFVILTMPYGGTITLAPFPIIIFAMRRGVKEGAFLGGLFGILYFLLTAKYSFHPLSILLDYIVPGAALGLVALGKHNIGFLLATTIRFASSFLSGVILFSSYAGDSNPILYSFIYNFIYIVPEMILVFLLIIPLKKFTPIFSRQ